MHVLKSGKDYVIKVFEHSVTRYPLYVNQGTDANFLVQESSLEVSFKWRDANFSVQESSMDATGVQIHRMHVLRVHQV